MSKQSTDRALKSEVRKQDAMTAALRKYVGRQSRKKRLELIRRGATMKIGERS